MKIQVQRSWIGQSTRSTSHTIKLRYTWSLSRWGRVLQVEVDKVRQTQWVPGGNVRAAKIAAGPLAHCCCRTTCVVVRPLPRYYSNFFSIMLCLKTTLGAASSEPWCLWCFVQRRQWSGCCQVELGDAKIAAGLLACCHPTSSCQKQISLLYSFNISHWYFSWNME